MRHSQQIIQVNVECPKSLKRLLRLLVVKLQRPTAGLGWSLCRKGPHSLVTPGGCGVEDLLFLPLGYLLQLTVWIQKGKNSLLISARKRTCGKVMFSQACVILSTGGSAIRSPLLGPDLLLLGPRSPPHGRNMEPDRKRHHTPTPHGNHKSRLYASYWNAFLFYDAVMFLNL